MKELRRHVYGRYVLSLFVFVLCSAIPLYAEFVFAKTGLHMIFTHNSIFDFKIGERLFATALMAVLAVLSIDLTEIAVRDGGSGVEWPKQVDDLATLILTLPFLYLLVRNIVVLFTGKPSLVADVLSILLTAFYHIYLGMEYFKDHKIWKMKVEFLSRQSALTERELYGIAQSSRERAEVREAAAKAISDVSMQNALFHNRKSPWQMRRAAIAYIEDVDSLIGLFRQNDQRRSVYKAAAQRLKELGDFNQDALQIIIDDACGRLGAIRSFEEFNKNRSENLGMYRKLKGLDDVFWDDTKLNFPEILFPFSEDEEDELDDFDDFDAHTSLYKEDHTYWRRFP